jgi:hypothetical protein
MESASYYPALKQLPQQVRARARARARASYQPTLK